MNYSPPTSAERRKSGTRPRATRAPSASEIARNIKSFETWSCHQSCEQVSYDDLPEDHQADVDDIFNVHGRLPLFLTDKRSKDYTAFSSMAPPGLLTFIQSAYEEFPALFSDRVRFEDVPRIFAELVTIHEAWRRLQKMRKSAEKCSEADFGANVYNVLRAVAVRDSTQRVHCPVSLPHPLLHDKLGSQASRILSAKTATPDGLIMIPASTIRRLSHSAKSSYKVLKSHKTVLGTGNASKCSSFRYQSTPCAALPDVDGFEFVSAVWEDKKPVHQLLEDAYRQNRMATASVVRHLHCLHVKAPVFGLVWANGTVRAHVDWCKAEEGEQPVILSAPYPGVLSGDNFTSSEDDPEKIFHEWNLHRPSDILSVFYIIRNLDRWTTTKFRDRVVAGVCDLTNSVTKQGGAFHPWKRHGPLMQVSQNHVKKENITISTSGTDALSTPPKAKTRRRRV